jgi:C1A family cysteine protease
MKKFLIILALVAFVSVEAQKGAAKRKRKDEPDFLEWRKKYKEGNERWANKDSASLERRADRVMQKKQRCADINNQDLGWKCGSNEFDHLTSDETKSRMYGLKPPMEARALPKPPMFNNFLANTIPTAVDWTQYCPPMYNQGRCGSCWAFAVLSNIECWRRMKGLTVTSLSPQYLIDCDVGFGNNQCNGGWPTVKKLSYLY